MKKIKIGVIGCGKQAGKHIGCLKRLSPEIDIAVADIDMRLAESLAAKEGCGLAAGSEEIFADPTINAVIICTPTPSHVALIRAALESGKDVFCEKPLSEHFEEAVQLQDIVTRSKRTLMLGYIYRFVPVFEECFRLVGEQRINGESIVLGRPLFALFRLGGRGSHQEWKHRRKKGGGAINEMLVHMIDLANWYFGPLDDIEVIVNKLVMTERVIQGELIVPDAEDLVILRCRGQFCPEILIQADLITPAFSQYVEIQGENGTFRGSIQADSPSFVFLKESRGGYDSGKTVFDFGRRNLLDIQMTAFIQSVVKRQKPDRNTLEDSLELLRLTQRIKNQRI